MIDIGTFHSAVPVLLGIGLALILFSMSLNSTALNLHAFHLLAGQLHLSGKLQQDMESCFDNRMTPGLRYRQIKQQEAELLSFSFDLLEQPLSAEHVSQLERQTREARALVCSSKTLNDIWKNLVDLRHGQHAEIGEGINRGLLTNLSDDNEARYREANDSVNTMASRHVVGGIELSTMLNINREVHPALKKYLSSLAS